MTRKASKLTPIYGDEAKATGRETHVFLVSERIKSAVGRKDSGQKMHDE